MLELTDEGRCISGLDAIEFLERIEGVIQEDAKTEEFCRKLRWVINRVRIEVRSGIPIPVRILKGRFTSYSCGQCGHGVHAEDDYCSKCGRRIEWNTNKGKAKMIDGSANMIQFNPNDLKDMCQLMDKYGNSNTTFPGTNESGERIHVSIFPDKIVVATFQTNDWTRKNTYYRDGSRDETYER